MIALALCTYHNYSRAQTGCKEVHIWQFYHYDLTTMKNFTHAVLHIIIGVGFSVVFSVRKVKIAIKEHLSSTIIIKWDLSEKPNRSKSYLFLVQGMQ